MAYTIYKIKCLSNNKCYIGQTTSSLKKRINSHFYELKRNLHNNEYLQNAWNKYGEKNFIVEKIIETNDIKELARLETEYIIKEKTYLRKYGFNLTTGGENTVLCQETIKKKIRAAKNKIQVAQYNLEGICIKIFESVREASRNLKISDSDIHRCCKIPTMTRKSFRFRKGKNIKPHIEKHDKNSSFINIIKKVFKFDKKTLELIDSYVSAMEASIKNNILYSAITQACRNKSSANGFLWSYDKTIRPPLHKSSKKILYLSENGDILKIYNSLSELSKELGTSKQTISKKILKNKKINNKIFKYERTTNN